MREKNGDTAEKEMLASCGCKMLYKDIGDSYETQFDWCDMHLAMSVTLIRIMDDFELLLAEINHAGSQAGGAPSE